MKRIEVEKAAKDIYNWMIKDGDWENSISSVKMFYRSIARWHLANVVRRCT